GLDFTDLREYEPGDDLRHIEWNVTARLDTPFVREYVEDREITTWLLLDLSPSMAFGPVARQKGLIVAEVATTIAHVLSRGGSRVGAVLFDTGVRTVIPPASGRNQVLRIAKAVLDNREVAGTGSVTDLGALFRATAGLARRRSLVIIVSDFISAEGWERPLALLARRHEVVALQVSDPRESELPDVGSIYVEDAETGEQIFVDTSDPGFRKRLRDAAVERQEALEGETQRAGVDLHRVSTDDDLVRVLVRVSELRRRRRR
ncbi:MAG TPA: DUF58 domain-containing protein, partial [Intrasporangium sp.]|nr:DUF58 domain-containing protein [Intrasporangium sp.]